jgi:hypothetical protein
MKPETILRAYRKTWLVVQRGQQGPIRRKRARQRNRFLMWLYEWADSGQPPFAINENGVNAKRYRR